MTARKTSSRARKRARRTIGVERWLPLMLIAAGGLVYADSFSGIFFLDDHRSIKNNPRIRHLWPPGDVLSGRRPVVDLTLAANYAFGKERLEGYHAVNLAVHILAGLTLYGVIRRTLKCKLLRDRFGQAAHYLALVAALIWVVHPLQTQSVTYLTQRSESMMGLFYLLTLYCVIRGSEPADRNVASRRSTSWYVAAVVFCALGMGSKGVMVTAPIVVLLYDRVFRTGSFAGALRRRWGLHAGLAATWAVLWACGVARGVLDPSRKAATVGFSFRDVTPLSYALTQFGVLVEYLRLSLWPYPQCLDYDWPVAGTTSAVLPQACAIAVTLIATAWSVLRRPGIGFLGASFFLILAPTSSFIPIRDPLFEHRMYLPLAAVVVLLVVAGFVAFQTFTYRPHAMASRGARAAVVLVAAVVALLSLATIRRNEVYHGKIAMWSDVAAKRPDNARAFNHLGSALNAAGRGEEALAAFRRAAQADPRDSNAHSNLGALLFQKGEIDEAVEEYRKATAIKPAFAEAHFNLGLALFRLRRTAEGLRELREAARLAPSKPRIHYTLGEALQRLGRMDEAVKAYRRTLAIAPDYQEARRAIEALEGE